MKHRGALGLPLALALACGSTEDDPDDAGPGPTDAGVIDGGAPDAASPDAGPVSQCGDLDAFDWRDAVLYFAMVDRFRDGDGQRDPVAGATDGDAYRGASGQYEGGDLVGLTERLPYLADLGVTALWITSPADNRDSTGAAINPVLDANLYTGYHGYWPKQLDVDWSDPDGERPRVESRIGTADDLRNLIDAAHASDEAVGGHGIKVLADYVMNHVDDESPLYLAHPDWFATDENGAVRLCGPDNLWDDAFWGTRCAFARYLPPFDLELVAPRAWSVRDAVWWATEFGFDGYRLDAIKHVPEAWLTELKAALDQAVTEPAGERFYLVGETFSYAQQELKRYIDPATKLDGQFDFPMRAKICQALWSEEETMSAFATWMASNDTYYGEGAIMATWVGNHDIVRAIHYANREVASCMDSNGGGGAWVEGRWTQPEEAEPYERLALAFAVVMTNPGVPLIYYGDEIGLAGGPDPDNRRMMPWEDRPSAPALLAPQTELRSKVRTLARIRGENPALRRGRRTTLSSDADTWVYEMGGCGEDAPAVVVALNRAASPAERSIPGGPYTDLVSGDTVGGGPIEVPARGYRILREN